MPRIFLSHSSKDGREATALKRWLASKDPSLDRQIFLDTDRQTGMVGGKEWEETIRRNLASSQALLCLLSKNWDDSKECYYEYKDAATSGKTIFCARLDESAGLGLISKFQRRELYVVGDEPTTSISLEDSKPPVVFATDGLERLLRDVQSPHLGADSFTWPPPDDEDRAPYRGWLPFESQDAAVFFGRDAEIRSALKALDEIHAAGRSRLFVILGPSGTGKSSFLRAGILPRLDLERDRFTVLDIIRPGRGEALTGDLGFANAIFATRTRLGLPAPALGDIKTQRINDVAKVRELLVECQQQAAKLSNDPSAAPTLILPVDQAEELFSAEAGQEARALLGLTRDLFVASDDGAPQLRLIVAATIRTDRYEVMQTAEELSGVDTLLFNDLKPMRTDRFRQVIEGPARRSTEGGHRLLLESHLVDRLLADASANTTAGGDTLPLLSGTMSRLFADYGHTGELTLAQYERMGGIDSVVQTEIDKLLSNDESVRAKQLVLLREAFIPWLATVSDQDEPMRRIALWSDLPQAGREMVEKFVDARILVRDRRRLGDGEGDAQDVVEIALESFLRQWKELAEWLRDEREHLKAADELLRDADRWQTSDQDPVYLYPGPLLEKAEKLAATPVYGRQLESTREFLVASRENVSQQQRRNAIRLWLVLAVTIVVAFAAVAGFFSARSSQAAAERSAQDATAQKLVTEAQAMLADTREGDDLQALHELLAANKLANQPNDRPLLDALVNRFSMLKILKTEEPVIGVAFAENGRRLAMAEPAGIRIWDTSVPGWQDNIRDTGQRLAAGTAKLTSMAISPDGRKVAAGDDAGDVHVWDTSEQDPAGRTVGSKHEGRVTSVGFSRDGRIASAGVDGVVDISSPEGGPSRPIVTGAEIFSVAFSPSGDRLALGRADGTIQLFDVSNPAPVPSALRANAHIDGVMSVAFSPDGQFLASGGADNKVRLWRAMTVDPIREMSGHTATVTDVAFNADSTRIVSGGNDKTVQLFDAATGTRIGDPMRGHGGLVLAVDFVSDSNEIVSGGNEHTMRLWDAVMGQPISTAMTSRTGPVTDVAISPDGHEIASSGTDKTVRLWNADTGAQIDSMSQHTGVVTSVAFSPVGRVVATASTDGTIRLWRPGSDAAPTKYDAGRPLTAVEFDATGDRLASAGVDGQVTIWDVRSGRPALLENKDHAIVYGVTFDPKNRDRLASVSASGYLRMWQVTDGRQLWERYEATELPEAVRAEEQLAQGYPGSLISVAFSPDGLRVASGGVDWTTAGGAVGFLQRWNVEDGSPVGEPIKVGNAVMGIAFSPVPTDPGGDQLVVASFDPYEVQLWNADKPGAAQFIFADHQAQVVSVAISPDGRRIVSGSADGSVRIWPNLPTVPADAAICAKLTSTMTEGEWDAWISEEIPYQPTCAEEPASEPN